MSPNPVPRSAPLDSERHRVVPVPGRPAAPAGPDAEEAVTVGEIAALKANVDRLDREVAELRETVARLRRELGA